MLHALVISIYVSICTVERNLENLVLWTCLLVGAVLALAAIGPFVADFAAKERFVTVRWHQILPFGFPEILDANLLANVIGITSVQTLFYRTTLSYW